jgi:hypothetical protein
MATLSTASLSDRLLRLVEVRATAAAAVEQATGTLCDARWLLQAEEDALLLTVAPEDLGKNESQRQAAIRERTDGPRLDVKRAEREQRLARAQLEQIDAELSVLKACARLVGGES